MAKLKANFNHFCNLLGYQFNSKDLLVQALTHRSASNKNNERLEFLGDSLLNLITAEFLFQKFSDLPEGELSRLRSQCVNKDSLFKIADSLRIKDYIQLGVGEKMGGGQNRPSILSDAVEAVIAAIYLDSSYENTRRIVISLLEQYIVSEIKYSSTKDPKTTLQEYLQSKRYHLPVYVLIETSGMAHDQSFKIECQIKELHISTIGIGKSRRIAEQNAANLALQKIGKTNE
ncbi:MAG: ribonuclease III [Betaproteobacteria bacterium]|nr:ribonuclease III [Betaproteobacteria bacterium]